MQLNWQTVDKWRVERNLSIAAFARESGIPENTIHRGIRNNSKLQPTTVLVLKAMFPKKFDEAAA